MIEEAFHFRLGDKVQNIVRSKAHDTKKLFLFKGEVIGLFRSKNGTPTYAVENDSGNIRLYNYFLELQP